MTDYSKADEINLIKAIHAGEESALKSIYSNYYQKLCIYILNFTTDRNLVEDVVQDTFLKLWNNREILRSNGSLNAYLYKITYNNFIDNYRKTKRLDQELDNIRLASLAELLDEDHEEVFSQRLQKVKEAIAQLPARCKEIFLMNKEKGMRYQQIADELDISVKTVENQIGKALQAIRAHVYLIVLIILTLLSIKV
ncbi:RNA polymerase sigma factor [Pedobacter sp. SL55]|uniref:RNA polymerase sigma factor n=1 Tax=Pedobacter sp. SL55 TaxID=2995161 RepID=UPI00226F01F7|nr:RNA polymerase sigma-70 factor [Pedobacter sp. SL55]WAC41629.1 RNA polymerase sigma-70 factor [Pedobacter sp. SL55]